jgi:hypothetical protein
MKIKLAGETLRKNHCYIKSSLMATQELRDRNGHSSILINKI